MKNIFVKSDKHVIFGVFIIVFSILVIKAQGDNIFIKIDNAVEMLANMVFSGTFFIYILILVCIIFGIRLWMTIFKALISIARTKNKD